MPDVAAAICTQTVFPEEAPLSKFERSFMRQFYNLGLTRVAISSFGTVVIK
jgi:hypothetical protein